MDICIDQDSFIGVKETYAELLSADYEEEGMDVDVDEILSTLDKFSNKEVANQIKDSDYDYLLHPFL